MSKIKKQTLPATADAMMRATARANSRQNVPSQTKGYFYGGNFGDSIERRVGPGFDGLGGTNDLMQGGYGLSSSYPAMSFGNFYGTGLGFGPQNRMGPFSAAFGMGGFQYLKRFSSNSRFNHDLIAQCMMAYLGYGVVRNIIDTYTDFACDGLEIIHDNKSVRQFFQVWGDKVNLRDRVHNIFMNMFITGNVFVHRRWASLSDADKSAMKRAIGSVSIGDSLILRTKTEDHAINATETFIDWFLGNNKDINFKVKGKKETPKTPFEETLPQNNGDKIPWGYTCLNPLQMELRGRRIQNQHYWVMALDKRDTMDIAQGMGMSYKQELGITEINLPKDFASKVSRYSGPSAGYAAEIKLSNDDIYVLQDRKFDWWDWSVPFVFPALRCLQFKDCLRSMEMRACTSVINSIFLFKLGNIKEGMPAEDEHFERLADMLQMPGEVMNIIWNDNIEAEVIQADVKGIFDPKKHESADRDILTALGVPEVLLGGKGGNFSNSYIAVAAVLERLQAARNKIIEWLMSELKIISEVMGFRKMPSVKFAESNLTDRKAEQGLLVQLFDRGILSHDSLLREFNTDFDTELAKQTEEKEYVEEDIQKVRGPFIKDPALLGGGIGGNPKTANGRPPGTPETIKRGEQKNKRAPKGSSIADITEIYEELSQFGKDALEKLEDSINKKFLKARGLKYVKEAPEKERERLEMFVYNVFSHMPAAPNKVDTDDFLINILQSGTASRVKADVLASYHDKIVRYEQRFGKEPSREMRRQFIISSWSQAAINRIYV